MADPIPADIAGGIVPKPPIGIVGSLVLTVVLIAAAAVLAWWFSRAASRDLAEGRGPLFLHRDYWKRRP